MNFRTEITLEPATFRLHHKSKSMLVGSCFSENIGTKLERYRFDVKINSHGIVFNPDSVLTALKEVVLNQPYHQEQLHHNGSHYVSLNHHGRFNHADAEQAITHINQDLEVFHHHLKQCDVLLVTFGSAWAYQWKEDSRIVANCHKIPQKQFEKKLLKHDEIIASWSEFLKELTTFNPKLQIVFSISPVRYWRDGVVENQLSKAQLILAVHELVKQFNHVHYFPAYELVMDDLRDYRFFKEDMLHPNDMATDYVWGKFCGWCMPQQTQQLLLQLEPHLRFLEHRQLHEDANHDELRQKKEALIARLLS
jgi:hypothetical protein